MEISRTWFTDNEHYETFMKEWERLTAGGEKMNTLQGKVLRAAGAVCEAWFGGTGGAEDARNFLRNATCIRPGSGRLAVIAGLAATEATDSTMRLLAGNAAYYAECRPLVRTPTDADEDR